MKLELAMLARFRDVAKAFSWPLVFWMSFGLMMAFEDRVRVVQRGGHPNFWKYLLVEGAACLTFALLTPAIFFIVRKHPVTRQQRISQMAAYLLGAIPFVVVFSCLRWLIFRPWSIAEQQFVPRTFQSLFLIASSFADQTWTYLATVVAAHAYVYMEERLELLQAVTASELQALKSQIHPHFLFNTLHGISTLIDYDRDKAKGMLLKLSNLLRTALKQGQTDLIPLSEELNFVQDYLAIEKLRLGDRLEVRFDLAPNVGTLLIPQLILQPLVENAIVHGIACCREGGWIEVRARRTDGLITVQISNSRCRAQRQGLGVGLQNTRSRLKYLYGDEAQFVFTTDQECIATASLTLPAFESGSNVAASAQAEGSVIFGAAYARPDR